MVPDKLKDAVRARPFMPFELRMPDGRSLPVPSPEMIFLIPDSRLIIVAQSGGRFNVVDSFLVTDLEYRSMPNVDPGVAGTPQTSPAA
jgi:hypothetical protein